MKVQNSKLKTQSLRRKYPRFVYEKYSYRISGHKLEIFFNFVIEPDISFKPKITIKNVNKKILDRVGERVLKNLIFHLGLIEIPSYWKATCSPEIEIQAGPLSMKASPLFSSSTNFRLVSINKEQTKWWKDLIMKGMGQFFYENKINFKKPNFLRISSPNPRGKNLTIVRFSPRPKKRFLVPTHEGKDSIVTLEKLKAQKKEINAFVVNPTKAAMNVLKVGGIKKPIIVERKIDPVLLKLNRKGFLNGHTPFTAVLSFLSVICAVLFNYREIAFSNEKSADEGNLKYLGKMINHQWSKSSDFERKFRFYSKKYLAKNIHYFSFLRNYTELEIAEMFSKYPKYFPVFLSCNEAYKTASGTKKPTRKWCCQCPKCLFVFAILYPFLEEKKLVKIFGKNLFKDKKLLPLMKSLMGQGGPKPFECVGTKKESRLAFKLSLEKAKKSGRIPYLLLKYQKII